MPQWQITHRPSPNASPALRFYIQTQSCLSLTKPLEPWRLSLPTSLPACLLLFSVFVAFACKRGRNIKRLGWKKEQKTGSTYISNIRKSTGHLENTLNTRLSESVTQVEYNQISELQFILVGYTNFGKMGGNICLLITDCNPDLCCHVSYLQSVLAVNLTIRRRITVFFPIHSCWSLLYVLLMQFIGKSNKLFMCKTACGVSKTSRISTHSVTEMTQQPDSLWWVHS